MRRSHALAFARAHAAPSARAEGPAGSRRSGVQLGLFSEATYTHIPESLAATYGRSQAVALNVGLRLFGMWMLDYQFRPMHHDH